MHAENAIPARNDAAPDRRDAAMTPYYASTLLGEVVRPTSDRRIRSIDTAFFPPL
jgi:hypothetical protein